jgi:hypothetical protein
MGVSNVIRTVMAERRRHERVDVRLDASARVSGHTLSGQVVNLSRGGARLELPVAMPGRIGQWVVLTGDGPLRFGLDARVVGTQPGAWRLAFDPTLTSSAIFDPLAALHASCRPASAAE